MTKIYYFSGTGHSLAVAERLSEIIKCDTSEINTQTVMPSKDELAVIIFPVYCQNIPLPVKRFLKKTEAKHVVLIATYGRISHGNVLYEAQNMVRGNVIAGAYIPIGHTFINGDYTFDPLCLPRIASRINTTESVQIPKSKKNVLSNIFPALRSRIGVKITKNSFCNECGICNAHCPMNAIKYGSTDSKCIRCLRCVKNCPQHALKSKNSWILNKYLHCYYHHCDYTLYIQHNL